MKKTVFYSLLSVALAISTVGCDVDETQDGESPSVSVDVEGERGRLPAIEFDGPNVDVSVGGENVDLPDVDVETK